MGSERILVGLIGAKIQKSLSPILHEDAFAAAGRRGHYHLMDLERLQGRTLPDLIAAARNAGFAGVNVTFPCKEAVMPLLDAVSDEARETGAVNTVTFDAEGRSTGFNTDRIGFRRNLEDGLGRAAIAGKTVLLVGAGGAGRAVGFALGDLGAASVRIYDQDRRRSTALAADLGSRFPALHAGAVDALTAEGADADGIVNATPIGMAGFPGMPLPGAWLRPGQWVADVVYTPLETALIAAARDTGARVITGGGMCVHQAAEAIRLFSGIVPDVARMKRVFEAAVQARDAAVPDGESP